MPQTLHTSDRAPPANSVIAIAAMVASSDGESHPSVGPPGESARAGAAGAAKPLSLSRAGVAKLSPWDVAAYSTARASAADLPQDEAA